MAIGIFDFGLGGLTDFDAISKRLPDVPLVYFGDNSHAPYGVRNADDIYDLTTKTVECLWDTGCELVILACNIAWATTLRRMQESWLPPDKRVRGVFVPLIEALTERQWGDNLPRSSGSKKRSTFSHPCASRKRGVSARVGDRG